MKKNIFIVLLLTGALSASAAAAPLWEGEVPMARGNTQKDKPSYTFYPAPESDKAVPAVIIFPGGGYHGLAAGHEGEQYAKFFNRQGYAAFVVFYRLGSAGYRHPVMLTDAARAVRIVRAKAEKFKVNPDMIGVIGSSAGGHLAATILTKFDDGNKNAADPVDRFSSRPDFGILCYPVITMGKYTHAGSRNNLLGKNASEEMKDLLSAEKQVKPNTPPCFIWHTAADNAVPVQNSLMFAMALREKKIPFELHIYPNGPHGLGLWNDKRAPFQKQLRVSLANWLKQITAAGKKTPAARQNGNAKK